jgi:hypothetical protein
VTRSARPGRSVDASLRDEVLTAAGHLAERLDGLVDAAALDREPLSLGVKRGLEELVGVDVITATIEQTFARPGTRSAGWSSPASRSA